MSIQNTFKIETDCPYCGDSTLCVSAKIIKIDEIYFYGDKILLEFYYSCEVTCPRSEKTNSYDYEYDDDDGDEIIDKITIAFKEEKIDEDIRDAICEDIKNMIINNH